MVMQINGLDYYIPEKKQFTFCRSLEFYKSLLLKYLMTKALSPQRMNNAFYPPRKNA